MTCHMTNDQWLTTSIYNWSQWHVIAIQSFELELLNETDNIISQLSSFITNTSLFITPHRNKKNKMFVIIFFQIYSQSILAKKENK